MSTTFVAVDAAQYEQMMGRWSRELAALFIEFAGVGNGESIIDVGCGTGSLTFALLDAARDLHLTAVDYSPIFLAAARAKPKAEAVRFEQADATALPFADASFDRALSLLVLHFVPESQRALAEMRRVVKPGGTSAAAVWDGAGGYLAQRMFWDTAACLVPSGEEARKRAYSRPLSRKGEMKAAFLETGFSDVVETSLTTRMNYAEFADYWGPIAGGEGPAGAFFQKLDAKEKATIERGVRAAFEGGAPDGPRSFVASAWACAGRVP
ncbi:MAG: methyltransferase domain-containing protein [Hyphomicrobiales bacterium]|nr:methyltransferase domain-containing protein [Hyphomicrobiales bacterium]